MSVRDHATIGAALGQDPIQPYLMHVSARYLELTRKKLELTRLPREVHTATSTWSHGTPKSVLEPLLDYWLEQYDWRAQEASLNNHLPQFRWTIDLQAHDVPNDPTTTIVATRTQRIHFVHKRCQTSHAIPLLYCHGWPGSFLEISKIVDGLSEPYMAALPPGIETPLGFHVVAPSIPGFGFSDTPANTRFGLEQTADTFNDLMGQLGYDQYVAHGSGFGFAICRALSLRHASNCKAVHAVSPRFPPLSLRRSYAATMRYQIAYLTGARYDRFAFGYTPADVKATSQTLDAPAISQIAETPGAYSERPQTRAFSLTDSPAGLLACVLDLLRPHALNIPDRPPVFHQTSKPGTASSFQSSKENLNRKAVDPYMEPIRESVESGISLLQRTRPWSPPWSPEDVLNWTMMIWLPGPEGGLRWLSQVDVDCSSVTPSLLWSQHSNVPLGISTFRHPDEDQAPTAAATSTASQGQSSPSQPPTTNRTSETGLSYPARPTWWSRLVGLAGLWSRPTQTVRTPQLVSSHANTGQQSPPGWAAAYQRLEWVRRHDNIARWPIWEASDQIVVDMRDFFGDMVRRDFVHLAQSTS